jgi:hypothetical protein
MAFEASRATKEERLSISRISRQGRTSCFALKKAHVLDQCPDGGSVQSTERGHPSGWNAVGDDLQELGIASTLHFRSRRNIWRALTAATINTVTPRTPAFKRLPGIGNRLLGLRPCGGKRKIYPAA